MRRFLPLALALLAAAAPATAQLEYGSDKASLERGLRICLTTGAPGAPRSSLTEAVTALRSLCYTQIRRVREFRLGEVDKQYHQPDTVLPPEEREAFESARMGVLRQLNEEINVAIANFTGLTP